MAHTQENEEPIPDSAYTVLAEGYRAIGQSEIRRSQLTIYVNALERDSREKQNAKAKASPGSNTYVDPVETSGVPFDNREVQERVHLGCFWPHWFISTFTHLPFSFPSEEKLHFPSFKGWGLNTERPWSGVDTLYTDPDRTPTEKASNDSYGPYCVFTSEGRTNLSVDRVLLNANLNRSPCAEGDVVIHELIHHLWSAKHGDIPVTHASIDFKPTMGLEEALCDYFAVLSSRILKSQIADIDDRFVDCIGVLHAFNWRDCEFKTTHGLVKHNVLRTCEERSTGTPELKSNKASVRDRARPATNTINFYAKRNYAKTILNVKDDRFNGHDEHCYGHLVCEAWLRLRDDLEEGKKESLDQALWQFFIGPLKDGFDKMKYKPDLRTTYAKEILRTLAMYMVDTLLDEFGESRVALRRRIEAAYASSRCSPIILKGDTLTRGWK